MGFSYLKNKQWSDITRDERFFCAHLYFEMNKNLTPFLELISKKEKDVIKEEYAKPNLWEVGYEVCFYRDYIKKIGFENTHEIGKTPFHDLRKRTFDLCLFSEKSIIIIEAKAHQGFDNDQMKSFDDDLIQVKRLLGNNSNVETKLLGLTSNKYTPSEQTKERFEAVINWMDLYHIYPNDIFQKANETYRK
jgi:hypothetical protein